jgi:hypothetical protein
MTLRALRFISLALAVSLAACGSDSETLSVDVQTGLVPGPEFDRVETTLFAGAGGRFEPNEIDRIVVSDVRFPDRFERGRRVAEFSNVAPGTRSVRVRLYRPENQGGTVLIERWVRVRFSGSYALLVRLDRDCVGAMCPNPGGSAAFSECLAGRCVDPECDLDDPSTYADHCCDPLDPTSDCPNILYCNNVDECAAAAPCAEVQCIEGACVESPVEGACEATEWCDPNPVRGGCRPAYPASADAGLADAGTADAGDVDGSLGDGGDVDSGFDAGDVDAGFDAGEPDLGVDAGEPDLGFDAGEVDAGFDAGEPDLGFDAGTPDLGFDAGTDAGPPPCYMEVCPLPTEPCRWGYIDCSLPVPTCVPFVDRRGGTPCTTVGGAAGICIRGAECVACTPDPSTGALPPACAGAATDTDGDGIPDVEDTETCDGLDNDGDGLVDDGLRPAAVQRYEDADSDGYGDPAAPLPACATTGGVTNATDCAPANARIHPGAIEICGDDDNCNGLVDETPYTDALGFGGGSGAVDDPFRICTPEHFLAITNATGCAPGAGGGRCVPSGSYFAQRRDLDFTPLGTLGPPETAFAGFYDGGGFAIQSYAIKGFPVSGVGVGIFGKSISGTVANLIVDASNVQGTGVVGTLAGFLASTGQIIDVTVGGEVSSDASAGGLVGQSDAGTIRRTLFKGTVYSSGTGARVGTSFDSGAGGLIGVSYAGITQDSAVEATVTWSATGGAIPGWTFTGGVIGYMGGGAGALARTSFQGRVEGLLSVGGLIGVCEGGNRIEEVHVDNARISGRDNVGGLVGYNKCATRVAWARADVAGGTHVGGLEGTREAFASSVLELAAAYGTVQGANVVGGLIGRLSMRPGATLGGVSDSYAITSISVDPGGVAGGFVGYYTSFGAEGPIVRRTYAAPSWSGSDAPGASVGGWAGVLNGATRVDVADSYFVTDFFRASLGESMEFPGVRRVMVDVSSAPESYPGFDFTSVWSAVSARDGVPTNTPALRTECDVTATCL